MKKRIINYLNYIDNLLSDNKDTTINENATNCEAPDFNIIIKEHLTQISFFSHERLIHLLVTITFAILTMLGFLYTLTYFSLGIMVLTLLLLILLIPYISHYYLLENSVQKMYEQYDQMLKIIHSK